MFICIKMDLAFNNLQKLICHKPKQTSKKKLLWARFDEHKECCTCTNLFNQKLLHNFFFFSQMDTELIQYQISRPHHFSSANPYFLTSLLSIFLPHLLFFFILISSSFYFSFLLLLLLTLYFSLFLLSFHTSLLSLFIFLFQFWVDVQFVFIS